MVAIVFVLTPVPLRWLDNQLWLVFFQRIGVSWFMMGALQMMWQIMRESRQPLWLILRDSFLSTGRIWITFYIALIIHFNIKINVGIWNPTNYDTALHGFDLWLQPALSWLFGWHAWVDAFVDTAIWYATIYEFLFLMTFVLFSLFKPTMFRQMFCATLICLLLGTGGYLLFPAIGPFIYALPNSAHLQQVMPIMLQYYTAYTTSGGAVYTPTYLIQGLAAMPSLHIANAAVFTYYIYKHLPNLRLPYLVITTFIALEAIYTKWHYVLDLPAGLLIASLAVLLTTWLYRSYSEAASV